MRGICRICLGPERSSIDKSLLSGHSLLKISRRFQLTMPALRCHMTHVATAILKAAEIQIRPERRLGELIVAQRETPGLATGGQPYRNRPTTSDSEGVTPTLADAGIDYKLSSRAQNAGRELMAKAS